MVRIDFALLGYRELKIEPDKLSFVTGILLRAKIPSKIMNNGTVSVRERDFPKVEKLFSGRIPFEAGDPLGLYGIYKKTKHKKAILLGILLSVIMMICFGNLVWDVRVEGNSKIPDIKIIEGLEKSGLKVGDVFLLTDRSKTEQSFLSSNPEISWININKRGTVAYITVIENENTGHESEVPREGYSNIVAQYDSVIEEISVKRGYALVKAGDTVKKGDILISGAIPTESGVEFCYAEGTVIGRLREEISAEVDREHTVKIPKKEKTESLDFKIFDFSINIFKKYGNRHTDCDIIEDIRSFSLFGKCKLPMEIEVKKSVSYDVSTVSYTDSELIFAASELLNSKTAVRLSSSDLIKIKSFGEFTEKGYKLISVIVFLSDIGTDEPFSAE